MGNRDFPGAEGALAPYTGGSGSAPGAPHEDFPGAEKALAPYTVEASGATSRGASEHNPAADRWGFLRHAVDSALYGKFTDSAQEEAKAAWEKENPGEATAAGLIGKIAPAVALSTGVGRVLLAGGELLGPAALTAARALVGTGGTNVLTRGGSLALGGAGQGAISAGYGRAMGGDDSIVGGAVTGAAAGPVLGAVAAPVASNISPYLAQLAKKYASATGTPLRLGQMGSAAPPVVRAMSRLLGMGKNDVPVLTKSLMAKTGSSSPVATRAALADAREDIKTSIQNAFPETNIVGKDANGNRVSMPDDAVSNLMQHLGVIAGRNASKVQAAEQAQSQWVTASKIERMMNNSSPEATANGLIEPRSVLGEIQNVRGPQYPGGIPEDMQTLGQGANIFARPASVGPSLAHASAAGTLATGAGALAVEHALPILEHSLGLPGSAAVLGAVGATGYGAAGTLMNNPLYLKMLLGKGFIGNPLIPAAQQTLGNDVGRSLGVTAANAKGATDQTGWEDYIRGAATKRGIDPDVAVRVAKSEGLGGDSYAGDGGSSFGPFQLHYGGIAKGGNSVDGLGEVFTKKTGLHASDPATVPQQIDFALDHAKENGWGPWHGWRGDKFAGISRQPLTIPMTASNAPPDYFGPQPTNDQISNALAGSQ